MKGKKKRNNPLRNLSFIVILFSGVKLSTKFRFSMGVQGFDTINPICSLAQRRYIVSFRAKLVDPAIPVSINLANYAASPSPPVTEFITDPDNPAQKLYGLYQPGSTCYMHDHRTTRNVFPFIAFVLKQANVGSNNCEIEGVITNTGIIPCSGTTKPVDEILQPKDENGASATLSDFKSFAVDPDYIDSSQDKMLTNMLDSFSVNDIHEAYVEMLLLEPLYSIPKAPTGASQISAGLFVGLNTHAPQNNPFILPRDMEKALVRTVWDDLPGYHLLPYQGPSDDPANYFHGSHFLVHRADASASINILMYMSDPQLLTEGKEHVLDIESRAVKNGPSVIAGYTNYHYQMKILRTTTHINFKVFRDGTTLSCSISLPYTGSTDFVYFGFTFGEGILTFKDSVNVKAKRYETMVLFHEGNKMHDIQTYVYETTVEKVVRRTNSHANDRWFKVQLIPAAGITTNEAGIRVIEGSVGIGVYPAFLISTKSLHPDYADCFYEGYSASCFAYPLLKNRAQTQVSIIRYGSGTMFAIPAGSVMEKNCRLPFTNLICSIPMPGSIVSMVGGRNRLYDQMSTLAEYEFRDQEDKNFFAKLVSNKGTAYLVSCPDTCK